MAKSRKTTVASKPASKSSPAATDGTATDPAATDNPTSPSTPPIRIIKKGTCPTVAGKSDLGYDLGVDPNGSVLLRVTDNSGGGYWSREWVSVTDVLRSLNTGGPITAILLWPLFRGQSVNTPAFVLAVITAEKLLQPIPNKKRVHQLLSTTDFTTRMDKLIASGVSLPDDLAKAAAERVRKTVAKAKPKAATPGKSKATPAKAKAAVTPAKAKGVKPAPSKPATISGKATAKTAARKKA